MHLQNQKILGATIGDCIHIAGIMNFLHITEKMGYQTQFLGPAVPIDQLIESIKTTDAKYIAISYRLTPINGFKLLNEFISKIKAQGLEERVFLLGCLSDLKKMIDKEQFFHKTFIGGETIDEVLELFQSQKIISTSFISYPSDLLNRISYKTPFPILRAHFGLPSIEDTFFGMKTLADSKLLDVISIAPDQAAQEWFHHPETIKNRPIGTGGVPIRTRDDLETLYRLSRTGNHPLLRIYSGTQDLLKNATLFHESIKNAWAAIPIFWYSELDGRGPLKLHDAIQEHFDAIKWHVQHDIPVEINDPHQWGLRNAPDHLVVADAFLSANIAKKLGVKTYIMQLMFNTPMGVSLKMDLARILAMIEIVEPLIDEKFKVLRETRAGLGYFSPNATIAKGQLNTSTLFQMAVKPHIMHVVSYCEGDHAAKPEDIIESCTLIQRTIFDAIEGLPDFTLDPMIIARKNELIHEAMISLRVFEDLISNEQNIDPYLSIETLVESVKIGLFDAPHLRGSAIGKGRLETAIIDGKCVSIADSENILSENDRICQIGLNLRI